MREEGWVAAELEGVLYIQSLILFAPQAVPAEAHLPMLLPPLASRHPALRRAAAATLRHLAEKSPSVMLPARLEKLLFNALDAEVDSDIGAHIQVLISDVMIPLCRTSASLATLGPSQTCAVSCHKGGPKTVNSSTSLKLLSHLYIPYILSGS